MAKVAFLGLGVMGFPMAGHLKNKGGHDVTVYNRNAAKADKWVAQYGDGVHSHGWFVGMSSAISTSSRVSVHTSSIVLRVSTDRQRPAKSAGRVTEVGWKWRLLHSST